VNGRGWCRLAAIASAPLFAAAAPAQLPERAVSAAPAARVSGVVYDSIVMRPLPGALVQLALVPETNRIATVRSMVTDSLGRFEFPEVLPGTYLLGFQHIAVDSLGLSSPMQRIDVRTASAVRASMAVPSMPAIIRAVCGRDAGKDSLAVLLGSIRHARTDLPLPGAFVSLRWGEVMLGRDGSMTRSTPIVDSYANNEGWFTACVPGGVPTTIRASHGTDLSGSIDVAVTAHAVLRRDVYVGAAVAEFKAADTAANGRPLGDRIVERGRGELRGAVKTIDGRPIEGARVALLNGTGETLTNAQGEFVLQGLPYGSHTIEARAIGYVPAQEIADIVEFRPEVAEFSLFEVAYLLDTVRVAAARRMETAEKAAFERRRRSGTGFFLDETVLDTLKAITFKDIIRRVPGARFTRGNTLADTWREYLEFTSGQAGPCSPMVYLNGTRLLQSADLDEMIHPSSVRRIEAYYRGVAIPAEFASNETCGVLAIWTAPRRR
jgi:hypothetical protein